MTHSAINERIRQIVDAVSAETLRGLFHGWDFDRPETAARVREAILTVVVLSPGRPGVPVGTRTVTPHAFDPRRQNRRTAGVKSARCCRCSRQEDDAVHRVRKALASQGT